MTKNRCWSLRGLTNGQWFTEDLLCADRFFALKDLTDWVEGGAQGGGGVSGVIESLKTRMPSVPYLQDPAHNGKQTKLAVWYRRKNETIQDSGPVIRAYSSRKGKGRV